MVGSLSRHTHPEGPKISWREDPASSEEKEGEGEGSLRRPREYRVPERLSSLGGAWVCGGRERVLQNEAKQPEDVSFLAEPAQGEV